MLTFFSHASGSVNSHKGCKIGMMDSKTSISCHGELSFDRYQEFLAPLFSLPYHKGDPHYVLTPAFSLSMGKLFFFCSSEGSSFAPAIREG